MIVYRPPTKDPASSCSRVVAAPKTCSLRAEVPGKGDYYVRCVQHQRAEDQLN